MFPAVAKGNDAASDQNEETSAIFLIDFDGTIADGQTHNAIALAINQKHITDEKESHWQFLRNAICGGRHHPIGSAEEWCKVFTTLLNDGHKVGIVSFSSFPHMIEKYIREVVGLPEDIARQVYVYAHLPFNPGHANKNHHIETAKNHFRYTGDMKRVVLIDDSFRNIVGANTLGCTTVMVDERNSHLNKILELSAAFKKPKQETVNSMPTLR